MALTRPDRALLAVVAVIGIGAVVAVQVTGTETDYPPGSPEAVVQQLLRDTVARDPAALDLLDPDLRCTERDLETAWIPEDLRVDVLTVQVTGDTARIRIEVGEGDRGELFGGYRREESLALDRVGGAWLVTEMTWPLWCEGSHR